MSDQRKQMKLIGVWGPPGAHAAGWREAESPTSDIYAFSNMVRVARLAEEAKMDALFLADTNHLPTVPLIEAGDVTAEGYSKIIRMDAVTMVSALAVSTSRIGLIATATTTYSEPYSMARAIATIDHLSGGRAGWNLVTTQSDGEAPNYGRDAHMEHAARYERAEEYFDVCAGLWDCWDDDALVVDKENARFSDVSKIKVLNHEGRHFKVKGPLNLPRSPQGRPVIAQAGASGPGRALASRIADVVFLASSTKEETKTFRDDVCDRAEARGRSPDSVKVMPGIMPIIGRTDEEARAHYLRLQEGITDAQGLIALRRISVGIDLTQYPLDGPMPTLPPTNGATTRQQIVIDWARKENLTLREVARRFAETDGHHLVWGTPERVADLMEDWFVNEVCDGFCVLFPYFPRGVEDFVQLVVPELQRRGIFRKDYEGQTLRDNLGLAVPPRTTRFGK
ncbi:LLM class flavin-dependent oxidoreductase [Rhizobium sp. CF142]|uniref:LLM class flavin-dependent oxidoreductase n=1 Tax=Rhizobium sp. CF142 TaxID=1144314 RepID=UPI00026EEC1D|nr:LLM class flavin-dependent oxidoreductase [Rhizobium sp. CF142]EJJ26696.1 FMN-dependent oxidoreductase, nitrilotriacetate monooxygenase family [Rhizobium sp. CF142]